MGQDEVVYQSGDIIVSKTLARFGGITYPVNGIGSVYVAKPSVGGLVFFGIVIVLIGAILAAPVESRLVGVFVAIVGALMLLTAWRKPHKLMLRTASGDQQAYESRNRDELHGIKAAIEKAVVMRG